MFEKEESEDIVIEWDYPKPSRKMPDLYKRTDIWYKRLKPFKKAPGRRGRIERNVEDRKHVDIKRNNIVRSLRGHDPYDKWKIETAKEDDGTFSIWATYEGRMNEDEMLAAERERLVNYEKMQRQMLKNKLAKQDSVARSALSGSLRPPVYKER